MRERYARFRRQVPAQARTIDGVTWRVRVDAPLAKGRKVRVVGMNGNVPIVEQGEES